MSMMRDGAVGAGDGETSGLECDVADAGLEQMGGDDLAPFDHSGARLDDRRAARHQRLRPAGAAARHELVGIGLHRA